MEKYVFIDQLTKKQRFIYRINRILFYMFARDVYKSLIFVIKDKITSVRWIRHLCYRLGILTRYGIS